MDICSRCHIQLPEDSLFCPRCGAPTGDDDELLASSASDPTGVLDQLRAATENEFTIVRELGRGGMGRVYLAHEVALERRVAMKVLPPTLAEQSEVVERFQREARTAGKLSHPNIVPVYQVTERGGLYFFTMPYIAGPSLRQVMRKSPQVDFDSCRRYLREAADALAYAHEQGVVHRDIKPENMLLEGSRDGRLLLTDFGIAKALGVATTLTRPGDVMGTPYYMSPEQCSELEDIDVRSDQYSLGMVAYEMLAGRFPLKADSLAALVHKHLNEYPEPLADVRPDLPADLEAVIERAIRKDREERFASMHDLLEALGAEVVRTAVTAPSAPRRRRRSRLRRLGWIAPVAAVAIAVAALGFALAQRGSEGAASDPTPVAELGPTPATGDDDGGRPVIPADSGRFADAGDPDSAADGGSAVETAVLPLPDEPAGDEEPAGDDDPARSGEGERLRAQQAQDAADYSRRAALDARADSVFPGRFAVIDTQFSAALRALERDELVSAALAFSSVSREFDALGAQAEARVRAAETDDAAPSDSVVPPSAPATAADSLAALLEVYRLALEAEDMERLAREVYRRPVPKDDTELLGAWMNAADSIVVSIEITGEPTIVEDRGEVRLHQSMRYVLSSTHERRAHEIDLRFFFRRVDDVWRLERIEL